MPWIKNTSCCNSCKIFPVWKSNRPPYFKYASKYISITSQREQYMQVRRKNETTNPRKILLTTKLTVLKYIKNLK